MSLETTPSSSGRERRDFYRITVTLPIRLQPEADSTEGEPIEKSVNLSGGGIGVVINQLYQPNEILSCTLLLPSKEVFKGFLEVLRVDPLPHPPNTYRLHSRFIRMSTQDRELLIRAILQLQREHLARHYSV